MYHASSKTRGKIVLFIVLIIVAAIIFISLPTDTMSLANLRRYQEQLQLLQESHPTRVIYLYFGTYFLLSALCIPGTRILTLLGGALFGLFEGTLLVLTAAASGATVAMLCSRYIFRDWVQTRFQPTMEKVNKGMAKSGGYYLFAMRLVPLLPFSLTNLLMGITPLPAKWFATITFIALLPSTMLYINTGRKLSEIESLRDILSPEILLMFLLLGLLPLISHWLLKRWVK